MAAGVDVLAKVKVAEAPGARAVPELLTHMMELASSVLAQPSELLAVDGLEGKLLPLVVQPYQKLLSDTVLVLVNVTV